MQEAQALALLGVFEIYVLSPPSVRHTIVVRADHGARCEADPTNIRLSCSPGHPTSTIYSFPLPCQENVIRFALAITITFSLALGSHPAIRVFSLLL